MGSSQNPNITRPLIGEILVKKNMITPKQLAEALEIQKRQDGFIGEILVSLGYLEERDIVVALVIQCGLPYIAVNKYDLDPSVLKLIPEEVARNLHVIPLDRVGDVLSVVMINPLNESLKEELKQITGCRIAPFIATKTEIDEAVARFYPRLSPPHSGPSGTSGSSSKAREASSS